ncbi:MAG: acyl carrier protein phosphodiesterase, partial [Bacteroidia bacterium]
MNFLAHLYLANGDDDLMLGALLGDFVRGRRAMWSYPFATREGIRLHRKIDKINDSSIQVRALQKKFPKEFRRYSGIIIDLAFDYELANSWSSHSSCSLAEFDVQVR